MKLAALSQSIAVRLLGQDQRVSDLEAAAKTQEARVEYARAVLGSKREASREEYQWLHDNFDAIHAAAQSARQRAELERTVLQSCRAFLERLPDDAKLLRIAPTCDDLELDAMVTGLAAMRAELKTLKANPPPAADIEIRVRDYVDRLAQSASPVVRGYAQGDAALNVQWGFDPYDLARPPAVLLTAALFPDQLCELIVRSIRRAQPITRLEHTARLAELATAIDEASYAVAAMLEKAGAPSDPLMSPQHWLGVRCETETANEVAA